MTRARSVLRLVAAVLFVIVVFGAGWLTAKMGIGEAADVGSLSERERAFTERLQASSLVGRFTLDGREDRQAAPDRYDISSVEKLDGDRWRFNMRMRHSGIDVTLPVVLPLTWVGDTPMINITDFSIPTLGIFTVRLFFYEDRYAGIWENPKVGGHMFGRIEKLTN
jgi:hypothetical protein